jgi:hypothetical protein
MRDALATVEAECYLWETTLGVHKVGCVTEDKSAIRLLFLV